MTETGVVYQVSMFGGEVVAGNKVDRCRAMLEQEPETRNDYQYAYLRYLCLYHGLGEVLGSRYMAFQRWFLSQDVPDYGTIRNRCQELMQAHAELQPPAEIMEKRQRQRTQGRIK